MKYTPSVKQLTYVFENKNFTVLKTPKSIPLEDVFAKLEELFGLLGISMY